MTPLSITTGPLTRSLILLFVFGLLHLSESNSQAGTVRAALKLEKRRKFWGLDPVMYFFPRNPFAKLLSLYIVRKQRLRYRCREADYMSNWRGLGWLVGFPGSSAGKKKKKKKFHLQCRRPWFDFWVRKFPWRRDGLPTPAFLGFPDGSNGKESVSNMGDLSSIPGLGRSSGGGHGNPLQYSCLENSMDRGAWQATVHGVTKDRTQLSE